MSEKWRDVVGYEGLYSVSSEGRVRCNVPRSGGYKAGHIMRQLPDVKGYMRLSLTKNGERRTVKAHRLVAKAFIGLPPTSQHQINHKNGKRNDNRVENLEWVTGKQNVRHAIEVLGTFLPSRARGDKNGMRVHPERASRGEDRWSAKLTESDVLAIRQRFAAGGVTKRQLADEYGVYFSTIKKVVSRKTWKHI